VGLNDICTIEGVGLIYNCHIGSRANGYQVGCGMWDVGCGIVGVWECGSVEVWECGSVGVWECGSVGVWECGNVGVCECED
jgi:hypothetical protein